MQVFMIRLVETDDYRNMKSKNDIPEEYSERVNHNVDLRRELLD